MSSGVSSDAPIVTLLDGATKVDVMGIVETRRILNEYVMNMTTLQNTKYQVYGGPHMKSIINSLQIPNPKSIMFTGVSERTRRLSGLSGPNVTIIMCIFDGMNYYYVAQKHTPPGAPFTSLQEQWGPIFDPDVKYDLALSNLCNYECTH